MTHNPYAPPRAPVAEARAVFPPPAWQIKVAGWLMWTSLAMTFSGFALEPSTIGIGDGTEPVFLGFMLLYLGLIVGLFAALIVCIGRAHRWARIVYSALVGISLVSVFSDLPEGFAISAFYGVLYLVTTLIDVATVVLLFTPAANTWFRQWREARRA